MDTRSSTPAPSTPSASAKTGGIEAPWSGQAEVELRRAAETKRDWWKAKAMQLEESLRAANAALKQKQDTIQFVERGSSQFRKQVPILRDMLKRWDKRNWAELCVAALKGPQDGSQLDMTCDIRDCISFRDALKDIHRQRDESTRVWLEEHAFRPEKMLLAKLAVRMSGRRCQWLNQLTKFDFSARDKDGEPVRKREMMHEDSQERAPQLFPTKQLRQLIEKQLHDTNGQSINVQSEDGSGAVVRDVPAALLRAIDTAAGSRAGGMATAGTDASPHWLIESMDGAGLTHSGKSGVRIVIFPGSVEKMNQSMHGVRNLVQYAATTHAESYDTLMAQAATVRTQLCRIYDDGYITRADGARVHVKLMLSADKSGMCHLLGRRNMNWGDGFSTQCDCKDADITTLTLAPLTHFDGLTFEKRSARAHIPLWEALEKPEPDDWCVECDICGKLSKQQVTQERARVWVMEDEDETTFLDRHARTHYGQDWGCEPVLPYHDNCTDILHLYLNIEKAAVAHVFHHPCQIEKRNYTPEVKALMTGLRDLLNARMKVEFDDKQFGGEGAFSLTGDQVKVFMRGGTNQRLLPDLLNIMTPYFELLTSDGEVPKAAPAPAPAPAPVPAARGRGSKKGMRGGGGGGRGNIGGRGRGGVGAARGRGRGHSSRTVRLEPEEEDDQEGGGESASEDGATPAAAPAAAAPVADVLYRGKVVIMFLALSAHWQFAHSVNSRASSSILPAEREDLAREAFERGCEVVRAVVAVCGEEQRQTYLHDVAYGFQKLFLLLGKAYLGATEGNEHAHQEMKKDFHQMCSHNNKKYGAMLQLLNLHHLRREVFAEHADLAPRNQQSQSMMGMELGLAEGKRKRANRDDAIPEADKHLKEDGEAHRS